MTSLFLSEITYYEENENIEQTFVLVKLYCSLLTGNNKVKQINFTVSSYSVK